MFYYETYFVVGMKRCTVRALRIGDDVTSMRFKVARPSLVALKEKDPITKVIESSPDCKQSNMLLLTFNNYTLILFLCNRLKGYLHHLLVGMSGTVWQVRASTLGDKFC